MLPWVRLTIVFTVGVMLMIPGDGRAERTGFETPSSDLSNGAKKADQTSVADGQKFKAFIATLWPEAQAKGISQKTFSAAFDNILPDATILELVQNQPEHSRAVWQYLEGAISKDRVAQGRALLVSHARLLDAIEAAYDVERNILVAIWGLESNFGQGPGDRLVVRSLATLAFGGGRRAKFGRQQLFAALQILQRGDISAAAMKGSWAGAMGHTQFIPTTYNAYAVDFDGDGRRDIWNSAADALASTANYLKVSGWVRGRPWGYEVRVPKVFNYKLVGRRTVKTEAQWSALKLARADGQPIGRSAMKMSLILPMGATGPGFLISKNFRAILRYNLAISYALAITGLASAFDGGGRIIQPWPKNLLPLGFGERQELQRRLVAEGYSTGGIDGILGGQSRAAIRAFQLRIGAPTDGFASNVLLDRLRKLGVNSGG